MHGFLTKALRVPLAREAELFELANLYPDTTGLPMTVWVSPKGGARHDARVRVCRVAGNHMTISNTAVVTVRPSPQLNRGSLSPEFLNLAQQWIKINESALIEYWDGKIDTRQFLERMRKV